MSDYNCSLCEECENVYNFQQKSLTETILIKLGEFILLSSVVIVLHLLDVLFLTEFNVKRLRLSTFKLNSKTILHMISLTVLMLTLPFITILITGALLYKVLCSVAIKRKDKRFVQFLDSFDVFYYLEDKTTTDVEGVIQSNTLELAVNNIKEKLKNVFINNSMDKIFYRRSEEYGFYYWRRYSYIDLAQYVQITEVSEELDQKIIKNNEISDQVVSYNDEGLFKVYITKTKQHYNMKDEYKITLKFHQTVKNAAMIEFIGRLVEKSEDCRVVLHSTPKSHENDSPDALITMIKKLCEILARSFDDNKKEQDKTIQRLKSLEWTKSDQNLLCKVKDVWAFNLTDFIRDILAGAVRNLER